ncbi:MAG: hypothetical protein AAF561_07590 [Planctomycetota bacterium]
MRLGAWVVTLISVLVLPAIGLLALSDDVTQSLDTLHVGWLIASSVVVLLWLLLATTPPDAIKVSPRLGKRLVLGITSLVLGSAVVLGHPTLEPVALEASTHGEAWISGEREVAHGPPRPPIIELAAVATRAVDAATSFEPLPERDSDWRPTMAERSLVDRLLPWRILLAIGVLGATWEIIASLRSRGISVWHAGLFAWSPAVWLMAAGFGGPAVLATWFSAASLRRAELGRRRRAGLWLALAVATSPIALLMVPWVLVGSGGKRLASLWFVGVSSILWVALLLAGDNAAEWVEATRRWLSAPATSPLAGVVDLAPRVTRLLALAVALLIGLVVWRASRSAVAVSYAALLAFAIVAPTHPAGLVALVLVPAAMLGPGVGLAGLALAGVVGLSLDGEGTYGIATWSAFAIVTVPAVAEVLAAAHRARRRRRQAAAAVVG